MNPSSNHPPRQYQGHPVAYRQIEVRHWIGGRGYVEIPMVEVWNPASAQHRIVITPEHFHALTTPAARIAA